MNECATQFRSPVLVLHGGKDYFNNDSDVRGFVARIPEGVSKTYHNYPEAYHLLMYDAKREVIFRDIETLGEPAPERPLEETLAGNSQDSS